ncbi:hypothetical protein DDB_G0279073 [Dictyostelium discoideum AX4]|uniref:Uncharacterized protein n=1 Tax=Dictyostelium discoideum TaxID=44689 RepID=Q54XC6_DICDI|nr:hypothetical protein DDB_G0279073 [Dictyostelium discoideum AX4]EAL67958.1 hypothetical protein DDB_G0279073 [Dictyostelium discoideum AX4]|eukprot:XP_641935.1 hypothetical protein DDB_G0279073 [Dictyostelium discoideum AX4]
MTLIKFLSKLVNKNNDENNGSISMNRIESRSSINTSEIDIFNYNTISSCNNTPQPSPYHQNRFNQPNFFEEIKREDDTRLLAYSL